MSDVLKPTDDPAWTVHEHGYDPQRERGIESRFSIGNGFLGVRGTPSLCGNGVFVSWPRTYVAGLFDMSGSRPAILSLVSAPDWVAVTILVDGTPLLKAVEDMDHHCRTLDMKRGALFTSWRGRTVEDAIVCIRSVRLVSLADPGSGFEIIEIHCGGQADISLEATGTAADAALVPLGVMRASGLWRFAETGQRLAMATDATLQVDGHDLAPVTPDGPTWLWRWTSMPGQIASLERRVGFARSNGVGADPVWTARHTLDAATQTGRAATIRAHEEAWKARWLGSDVVIEGDARAQHAIRFAIYHLNSAGNGADEQVSIGARALTGEDYHGHVFWDTEIFLLPFYTMTLPKVARALLMYRFHRLAGARAKAARMGWQGAFYAWESAGTGDEVTPEQVVTADGTIVKILSGQEEEHISADVAYATWHYWWATGDDGFLCDAGAEILFETARFWASRAGLEADGKRHIRGVEGPDEYHEHIDDNAYTNAMARCNIRRAVEVAALLRERWPASWTELAQKLSLTGAELEAWTNAADTMETGLDPRTGLFEQFSGFFKLDEVDLCQYASRTTAMDVVLGRDQTQRSQVIKQADVVALIALLPEEIDARGRAANFHYYEPRCDQGSSLSRAMHAQVAARLGETDLALRYFHEAASIDLADTAWRSAGGVHIATLGGLWQAAVFGFAGVSMLGDGIAFDPHLPRGWDSLGFNIQWRGRALKVRIERDGSRFEATLERGEPMVVTLAAVRHTLVLGSSLHIGFRSAGSTGSPPERPI